MSELKLGTYKEIKKYVNKGYSPVGTLKFVLDQNQNLLEDCKLTIYIDNKKKIIDIQEEYIRNPYSRLINYMRR